jgi:hypothetical protein
MAARIPLTPTVIGPIDVIENWMLPEDQVWTSARFGRNLKRKGLLVRDLESNHLAFEPGSEDNALADLQGHSITYR